MSLISISTILFCYLREEKWVQRVEIIGRQIVSV